MKRRWSLLGTGHGREVDRRALPPPRGRRAARRLGARARARPAASTAHRLLAPLAPARARRARRLGALPPRLRASSRSASACCADDPLVAAARPILEAEAQRARRDRLPDGRARRPHRGAREGRRPRLPARRAAGRRHGTGPRDGRGQAPARHRARRRAARGAPRRLHARHAARRPRRSRARSSSRARRGFAENRDEWIPGLAVVAAPVFVAGRMQAAISIALAERAARGARSRAARRARDARGRARRPAPLGEQPAQEAEIA